MERDFNVCMDLYFSHACLFERHEIFIFYFYFKKNVGVITYFSFFKAKIKQEKKRYVTLYLEKIYLQKSNLDSKLGYLLRKYGHKL